MIIPSARQIIRREKWRLRPLKRLVLPFRNVKRQIVTFYRVLRRRPLPRIERSTVEYVTAPALGAAIELYPAEPVRFLPHPFGEKEGSIVTSKPAHVFELRDIDFWARYGGSVVTSDNRLLADLSPEVWGVENHPIFSTFRLPKSRRLAGHTAICVTPEAPGNYYHWLVDLLPRVALLKKVAGRFDNFDQIVINGSGASYEKDSLAALGVPSSKVLFADRQDRFRILRATIPSMDHSSKIVAPWKIRALREIRNTLLDVTHSTPKRIYVSRERAAVRRVVNETELVTILREAGFNLIEVELLPWAEQVRWFSNADMVIAPHGAALANIVFCQPNTLIAEIGTRAGYRDFYWRLAASASLRYRFFEARPRIEPGPGSRRAVENEDMIVDEQELKKFLHEL